MTKRIAKTDRINELIARAAGDENFDTSTVAVFEAISLNTLPLLRRTGLFAGAVVSAPTLREMAEFVQGDGRVTLQIMHETDVLPVGKVIHAEVRQTALGSEIRSLFYIPLSEEETLQKVDSGLAGEVSVGVLFKHGVCSECTFDFMGPEADFVHLFDATCDNGHVIGEGGCHLQLSGLSDWAELSLVGKGAANNARIVSSAKSELTEQEMQRMAASGINPRALYFFGSAQQAEPEQPSEENDMDTKELMAAAVEASADLKVANLSITTLEATVADGVAKLAELQAKFDALQAETDELLKADSGKLQTEIDALKASAEATFAFLSAGAVRTEVALGNADYKVAEDATAESLMASITEGQEKLAVNFPAGGASNSAEGTSEAPKRDVSMFKTPGRS